MNNIIFIPAYNNFDQNLPYGIKTWEFYCKKHNIELIIANKSIQYDFENWGNGCWEPWFDKQLIDKDFDNILLVDCDTMIRWDAPNIFDDFKNDINVIRDAGGEYTGVFHLNQWIDINSNIVTPPKDYFNTGFVLLNRDSYFKIKDKMPLYYEYWASFYKNGPTGPNACEQTPVNILTYELSLDIKYLGNEWNNMVMAKYDDLSFLNDSYIWHFTGHKLGGPDNKGSLMEIIFNHIKTNYE
jgi:hypothetical protein